MSTGDARESTAARSAALQAVLDAARTRFGEIERRMQEQLLHINKDRIGMIGLLAETRKELQDGLRRTRREIRSTQAMRRRVLRRSRWVFAGLQCRIAVLKAVMVVRIVFKWAMIALLAGWCLWWGYMFRAELTDMIGGLLRDWGVR